LAAVHTCGYSGWNEHFDDLLNKNNNQEHTIAEDEEIQPIE
jgi:hypothetical protein